jgi:hypothetical protein
MAIARFKDLCLDAGDPGPRPALSECENPSAVRPLRVMANRRTRDPVRGVPSPRRLPTMTPPVMEHRLRLVPWRLSGDAGR